MGGLCSPDRCGFVLERYHMGLWGMRESDRCPANYESWARETDPSPCSRRVWKNGRCVWHAELPDKPLHTLVESESDEADVFDGVYLNDVDFGEGFSFSNRSLKLARMHGTKLRKADLSGADLLLSDLREADLRGADLTDANLENATLAGADLSHADLSGANLWCADLSAATLDSTVLSGAELRFADLSGSTGVGADFSAGDLAHAVLTDANLTKANFTDANLSVADLTGTGFKAADLSKSNLSHANLSWANFYKSNLTEANLNGADALGANFTDTTFRQTRLSGTNMQYAFTDHAHFQDVFLNSNTDLTDPKADHLNVYELLADWIALGNAGEIRTGLFTTPDYVSTAKLLFSHSENSPDERDSGVPNFRTYDLLESVTPAPRTDVTRWNRAIRRWRNRPLTETTLERQEIDLSENPATALLKRANRVYLNYQRILRENGMGDEAATYFVRRKEVQRKLARAEGNTIDWLERAAERWLLGYGEKPWHIVGLSMLVVVSCTLLYTFFGVVGPSGESELITDPLSLLTWSLLLSISTFLLAGDASGAEVNPDSTLGHVVTTGEAMAGAVLLALLFFVLGRVVER